ncbi:MAG: c-type cytochrome biogenesis protein CcmI [Zoogloeaceae bacterium]|nr:c-type cytochrome biogenesis protein CcmI [Zoogloeaceae bacterium]
MIEFALLSALLVAGALLLVVPPLLGRGARRRAHAVKRAQAEVAIGVLREQLVELKADHAAGKVDDATFERNRSEIEQRVLEEGQVVEDGADQRPSRIWALALVLVVPLSAMLVYSAIGEPEALDPATHVAQPSPQDVTPEQFAGLVAQLAERLDKDPSDETGWMMLARSYMMLGQFDVAAQTWSKLRDRAPDSPDVLTEWADLLVAAGQGNFEGEPLRLIERALELAPTHFKALALAGAAAFERQDYRTASAYWERILEDVPEGDPARASVVASINEARSRAGLELLEVPASADALTLSGSVRLSEALKESQLPESAIVFIFARPAEGGMPFAAIRFPASALPTTFDFSNAQRIKDGPLPDELVIAARISMSGDAAPQAGDLESLTVRAAPGANGIELLIDRVRQ